MPRQARGFTERFAALEIPPLWESDGGAQYANLVVSDDAEVPAPLHIGFVARSREEVDAFHRAGIEAGFEDNGEPGVREQSSSDESGVYYAAFLLDPNGNNIEAVCRGGSSHDGTISWTVGVSDV